MAGDKQRSNRPRLTSKRGPLDIVAASLYIATIFCGERRKQFEISEVTDIAEVTNCGKTGYRDYTVNENYNSHNDSESKSHDIH